MSAQDLREARARLGMSQTQLARALGIGHRTLVGWERGEAPVPRLAELALREVARCQKAKAG